MGILDFLKPDPSKDWPEHVAKSWLLSLQDFSLNEFKFGDSVDKLQKLGRPGNKRPFKAEKFNYSASGAIIEIDQQRLCYFALSLVTDEYEGLEPARFELLYPDGHRALMQRSTTLDDCLEHLDEPVDVDTDPDEIVATFKWSGVTLELECSPQRRLRRINLFPSGPGRSP